MTSFKMLVLKGDGIGPEVVGATLHVLEALEAKFNFLVEKTEGLLGAAAIDATGGAASGTPLPQETIDAAHNCGVVLLGAVGDPRYDAIDPERRPERGLLGIRKALGLYANLRPIRTWPALLETSPLRSELAKNVDMIIVRELTGGLYFGQPKGREGDNAVDTMRYSRDEISRIATLAFELAQGRRQSLCSVDKANVLATSQLWREVVTDMGQAHPEVKLSHQYVDNAAMQLVIRPAQFDVLLTENTFGDILSDEASVLAGSLGMLPSASLGAGKAALYEPCHGSAPDIAGQDKANPIAQILSLAMLLELSYGLTEPARALENSVTAVLDNGLRTADLSPGPQHQLVGTQAMAEAIIQQIQAPTGVKVAATH